MKDQREPLEKVMTVEEVSTYLKIPVSTLYEITRKGRVRGIKVGRRWRYLESDILAFLHGETNHHNGHDQQESFHNGVE